MPSKITVYDILISCPSDVEPFISYLETSITYFNSHYGKRNKIGIRPIHWSKNVFSTLGKAPQNEINEQIVKNCDMVIGVFWTRFGTKTENYNSGTEEEIEYFINNDKQAFLYFMSKSIAPDKIDLKQYQKINSFKDRYKQDGIYFTVNDEKELSRKFCEDLELYFDSIIKGADLKSRSIPKGILWVDDRPENNVYERKILERYGLDISLALNTKQALEFLRNKEYALIISDMGRKEGPREGYVLLDEIRKSNRDIPYIIYAGSKLPQHIKETEEHGGQGCTNEAAELVDTIIRCLLKN